MRKIGLLAVTVVAALLLAGCDYRGLNDFTLPGDQGTGPGSYEISIELRNVGDLVPNNPVRLADLNVGTIKRIKLDGWNALVTVSLNPDVRVPSNVIAKVGQVSLLGAKYIELDEPPAPAPTMLASGSRISLAQSGKYLETEDVLAAVAALLNGGGIQQLRTITTELNKAMNGRTPQLRDLMTQLNAFVSGLDAQKADIVRAIDGLDRLSARFASQNTKIQGALDAIPPALQVLNQERDKLTTTLTALGDFGVAANEVIQRTSDDLAANVANLQPALAGLADSGKSLTDSLGLLGTIVFPLKGFSETFRGDHANFWLTLDLTLGTLDRNFLTGTPFAGSLGNIEKVLAGNGGSAVQMTNPLLQPVQPAPAPNTAPAPAPVPGPVNGLVPDIGSPNPPSGAGAPGAPAAPPASPTPEPGLDGLLNGLQSGS